VRVPSNYEPGLISCASWASVFWCAARQTTGLAGDRIGGSRSVYTYLKENHLSCRSAVPNTQNHAFSIRPCQILFVRREGIEPPTR
jgi:hypothetical protein